MLKETARSHRMSRRRLLAAAGLAALPGAGTALAGTGLGESAGARDRGKPGRDFPQVHVSPDRVIRVVTGLRPYRPGGFVVRAEKLGEKLLVHNYGHGGCGVTLSWGTSQLAADEVTAAAPKACAVLGCGAVGLATARLLQNRGVAVTIYARALPPDTTSNVAGAIWFPVTIYDGHDPAATTPAFREQFTRACRLSQRRFQDMVGDHYGVRWLQTRFLYAEKPTPPSFPGGSDLYPAQRSEHGSILNHPYAESFYTMLIEPNVYLDALLRDFELAGGKVVVRAFASPEEVARLPEPAIVNCTGLGAGALFGDREIRPVKGQLVVLLPQSEIDYAYVVMDRNNLLYMFPRKDGILLGGTEEDGNGSLEPDPKQTERILKGHARIQGG